MICRHSSSSDWSNRSMHGGKSLLSCSTESWWGESACHRARTHTHQLARRSNFKITDTSRLGSLDVHWNRQHSPLRAGQAETIASTTITSSQRTAKTEALRTITTNYYRTSLERAIVAIRYCIKWFDANKICSSRYYAANSSAWRCPHCCHVRANDFSRACKVNQYGKDYATGPLSEAGGFQAHSHRPYAHQWD